MQHFWQFYLKFPLLNEELPFCYIADFLLICLMVFLIVYMIVYMFVIWVSFDCFICFALMNSRLRDYPQPRVQKTQFSAVVSGSSVKITSWLFPLCFFWTQIIHSEISKFVFLCCCMSCLLDIYMDRTNNIPRNSCFPLLMS